MFIYLVNAEDSTVKEKFSINYSQLLMQNIDNPSFKIHYKPFQMEGLVYSLDLKVECDQ